MSIERKVKRHINQVKAMPRPRIHPKMRPAAELKQLAQNHLIGGIQLAFSNLHETNGYGLADECNEAELKYIEEYMDKWFRKVEQEFGFAPGSHTRGV